jgi:hypothetical protein
VKILSIMNSIASLDSPAAPAQSGSDRRKFPRYGLVAIAELTDPEEGKMLSGRIAQISRSGCYVETPKTFPVGTALKVIVSHDERTFVTKANIIHVQQQIGMGIAFLDVAPDQLKLLDSWLAELPSVTALAGPRPASGPRSH